MKTFKKVTSLVLAVVLALVCVAFGHAQTPTPPTIPGMIYEDPCAPDGWSTYQNYYGRTATRVTVWGVPHISIKTAGVSEGLFFDSNFSLEAWRAPWSAVVFSLTETPSWCTYVQYFYDAVEYVQGTAFDEFSQIDGFIAGIGYSSAYTGLQGFEYDSYSCYQTNNLFYYSKLAQFLVFYEINN